MFDLYRKKKNTIKKWQVKKHQAGGRDQNEQNHGRPGVSS